MLQRRKLETRSLYRSVRYRVSIDEESRTANPSAWGFRIKKNQTPMQSTMAQTIDSGFLNKFDSIQTKLQKPIYLRSFNSVMERSEKVKTRVKPRVEKSTSFFENSKIILPNFQKSQKQVEQSEFSLLTPFGKPFNNSKVIFSNASNQLTKQKQICEQIKYGLTYVEKKTLKQLQQIKIYAQRCFSEIRNSLMKNQISQQQKKLSTKREIELLKQGHIKDFDNFKKLDSLSSDLQTCIFSSTPFNLKQQSDFAEQVYF